MRFGELSRKCGATLRGIATNGPSAERRLRVRVARRAPASTVKLFLAVMRALHGLLVFAAAAEKSVPIV